jgi:hypothetical protein
MLPSSTRSQRSFQGCSSGKQLHGSPTISHIFFSHEIKEISVDTPGLFHHLNTQNGEIANLWNGTMKAIVI